jgi:hypothetical protein
LSGGLAQLIWRISERVRTKLGVPKAAMLEHVLNQNDLWSETTLEFGTQGEEDEEGIEDSLEEVTSLTWTSLCFHWLIL